MSVIIVKSKGRCDGNVVIWTPIEDLARAGIDSPASVTATTRAGGVLPNFTTFVSRSELIADINIDVATLESLYDIEVTTRRGKKGGAGISTA